MSKETKQASRARKEGRSFLGGTGWKFLTYTVTDDTVERADRKRKNVETYPIAGVSATFESLGDARSDNSRISLTRVATVGVFALAAPKRSGGNPGHAYVTVTGPDFIWTEQVLVADTRAREFVNNVNLSARKATG